MTKRGKTYLIITFIYEILLCLSSLAVRKEIDPFFGIAFIIMFLGMTIGAIVFLGVTFGLVITKKIPISYSFIAISLFLTVSFMCWTTPIARGG